MIARKKVEQEPVVHGDPIGESVKEADSEVECSEVQPEVEQGGGQGSGSEAASRAAKEVPSIVKDEDEEGNQGKRLQNPEAAKDAPEPAGSTSQLSSSRSDVRLDLGKQFGGRAVASDTYVEAIYNLVSADAFPMTRKSLSHDDFVEWDSNQLEEEASKLLVDELRKQQIVVFSEFLEERRILILVGKPEIGKLWAAVLVANQLRTSHETLGTLVSHKIERSVRVEFSDFLGRDGFYRGKAVILKDVFDEGHADFLRFIGSLAPIRLEDYIDRLKDNSTYLIFTSDLSRVPAEGNLRSLGLLQELSPPSDDLLIDVLREQASILIRSCFSGNTGLSEKINQIVVNDGTALAAKLATLPRLTRFVREYFVSIAEEKITVDQAIERLDDLKSWLLLDLPGEFDSFCGVLALITCSATGLPQGVPWFQFERVRREMGMILRRELRRSVKEREILDLCRNESVLEKARAEVSPSSFPEADSVRFNDDRYPDLLWQVLLGPGRGLLTLLKPFLDRLIQDPDPYLRISAVRALGRIGQVDPFNITNPLLEKWIHTDDPNLSGLLGPLLQGILTSEVSGYRNGCLNWLRREMLSSDIRAARNAIVSLKWIGDLDLTLALNELVFVVEKRLKPDWDFLKVANRALREYEAGARNEPPGREEKRVIEEIREFAEDLLTTRIVPEEEGANVIGPIQYTLAGLMFAHSNLTPILTGLVEWMRKGCETIAPAVSYLFLHENGIASLMQRYKLTVDRKHWDTPIRCNRILYSIWREEEACAALETLLGEVFASLSQFPGIFSEVLGKRFLSMLKEWAEEACEIREIRGPVVGLLASLYNSSEEGLSKAIDGLLCGDRDFANDCSKLHSIAIDVLTWMPPRNEKHTMRPTSRPSGN